MHDSPDLGRPAKLPDPVDRHTRRGRVVVVDSVTHQEVDGSLRTVGTPYAHDLEGRGFLTQYRLELLGSDVAWLQLPVNKEHGLVIVHNLAPSWRTNPTADQRAEAATCVVELSFRKPPQADVVIAPGRSVRVYVTDLALPELLARCRVGTAEIILSLFPR